MTDKPFKRQLFARNFSRQSQAAIEGKYLPSTIDLLLGMPFKCKSLPQDAQAFADMLFEEWPGIAAQAWPLACRLKSLSETSKAPEYERVAKAFRALRPEHPCFDRELFAKRYDYYAACCGSYSAIHRICQHLTALADKDKGETYDLRMLFEQVSGWLLFAAQRDDKSQKKRWQAGRPDALRDAVADSGCALLYLMIDDDPQTDPSEERGTETLGFVEPSDKQKRETDTGEEVSDTQAPPSMVVFRDIGNQNTSEGKRVHSDYSSLINKRIPLVPLPDITAVHKTLLSEFPHAEQVISTLLNELPIRKDVYIRPTVLLGLPGSGKTRFAQRFLSELSVPHETYSCGGVSDGTIAGTPRRWSTGEPSLPVSQVRRHNCASPGIVLDELEKAGTSHHNGNIVSALLGLLETQSAQAWHDPYLEAQVDVSRVIWLATVNSLDSLQAPFKDRCRILTFPEPGPEHLETIANTLLVQAVEDLGLDRRWALPLTGEELSALSDYWKGGSIRHLRRYIDPILAVREQSASQH